MGITRLTERVGAHSFLSCYLVTVVSTSVGTFVLDGAGVSVFALAWTPTGRPPERVQSHAID